MDEDGYPTEELLEEIARWPVDDFDGLMQAGRCPGCPSPIAEPAEEGDNMLTHAEKRLTVASVNRSMPVNSPSEPARALASLSRFERDWPRHGRSRETPAGRMVARMEAATEYSQLSELLRVREEHHRAAVATAQARG